MPQTLELTFRAIIPENPPNALEVCITWITKKGKLKDRSNTNGIHTLNFITSKHMFSNSLQRSLRTFFSKSSNNLREICDQVHVYFSPLPTATRQQMEARITQLEDRVNVLSTREPTVINNNNITNIIVLQNFGDEDMSYLQNPTDYLENTFAGMHALLKDIYFNDEQTQNHTVRINMTTKKAEVHNNGEWRTIAMPIAKNTMIGNCRTYLIKGFNSDIHKTNDDVMDFVVTLGKDKTTAPLHSDINEGLIERHNRTIAAIPTHLLPHLTVTNNI